MLDPANDFLPPLSSPTVSSISSSDLDTESTGSFFHDRSTTLGTLMGVTFPSISFRTPSQSQRRESNAVNVAASAVGRRRSSRTNKALVTVAERRRRRWWRLSLCREEDSRPSSLGEFLEVERRFGDGAFYGATTELERPENGRLLFADGRVLPPARTEEESPSTAGALCVSLTSICSGGAA
ncbi:hypothetical protein NMG60_11031039 [Bertholletia excelsa]